MADCNREAGPQPSARPPTARTTPRLCRHRDPGRHADEIPRHAVPALQACRRARIDGQQKLLLRLGQVGEILLTEHGHHLFLGLLPHRM